MQWYGTFQRTCFIKKELLIKKPTDWYIVLAAYKPIFAFFVPF